MGYNAFVAGKPDAVNRSGMPDPVGLLCLIIWAALPLAVVLSAPAPMKKPTPVPAVSTGSFVMTWRGVDCVTHFHHDGFFACHWMGRDWHGTWECTGGELSVRESPCHDPTSVTRWTVRLKTPTAGTLSGDCPWKLVPLKGRRVD